MELAAAFGTAKSGGLIVAAIAAVFTIGYVANLLGEDEDWLYELSIDMFPEDGCLGVYGVGEDGVTAFTKDGIECLRRSSPTNEPPAAHRRRSNRPNSPALRCSPHGNVRTHEPQWALIFVMERRADPGAGPALPVH